MKYERPFSAEFGTVRDKNGAILVSLGETTDDCDHARTIAALLDVDEAFWVVEKYVGNRLHYWSAGARGRGDNDDWANNIEWATKFADRQSADQVLFRLADAQGRSVQHSMLPVRAEA